MREITAASLAVVVVAIVLASSDAHAQDARAKFIEKMIEKFDKNGNGQLDGEELKAVAEYREQMKAKREADQAKDEKKEAAEPVRKLTDDELLEMYDINGNGRLDPEERLIAEQEQKKKEAATKEPKTEDDKKISGMGEETWDDFEKRLIAKYDENNNEKLDSAERKKAAGDIAEWRVNQRKIKQHKEAALRGLTIDQRRLLAMFDDNKDFKLDDEEREYAREQFTRLRKEGLEGAGELLDRFMEQFDANKNGKLDPKERPAALQFVLKVGAELDAAKKRELAGKKWPGKARKK